MSTTNEMEVRIKCKQQLQEFGFEGLGLDIFSFKEAAAKHPEICNPYGGNAKWLHLNGAKAIVVDTDKVTIRDKDFDRSLCHEAYHEEFNAKTEFQWTNLAEQLAFRFVSEIYVEKQVATILPNGEMADWQRIIAGLQENTLGFIIDYNYNELKKVRPPHSIEQWWILITQILFLPLYPTSFYCQKGGHIPTYFQIHEIYPGDPLSVGLQQFCKWLGENIVVLPTIRLISADVVQSVAPKILEVDELIRRAQ